MPGALSIRRRAPVWPTPLGVVYIVFGVFAFMMAVSQALMSQVSMNMVKWVPGTEATVAGMEKYRWESLAVQLASAVCAALLIVAGIFVLLHRKRAVPMAVVWAILKILVGIGVALLTAAMQKIQMEATMAQIAKQSPRGGPPAAALTAISTATVGFTVIFAIVWAAALPVFSLIWFRLSSVRETVAAWRR